MSGITRREWLSAAALVPAQTQQQRPNILFVIADDQSWAHAGAYGARQIATPSFDSVARDGVLFRNSFSAAPSCTPSRSAVLSGHNLWQTREAGLLYGSIPTSLPLYTHLLEDAGYFVGYTGKGWGPGNWSFQGLKRNPCGREFNGRKHTETVPPGIDARDYAANFADFLEQKPANAPFCFWFGSTEPHRVYDRGRGVRMGKKLSDAVVPPFLPDTPEVRSDLLDYYSEIEWFDQQLGRVLKTLAARGHADDTLVVVTSDNGMPFPRAKVNVYDWGVHMPLAVRWPARVRGGRAVDDLVSHTDFAPTFLEAAGVRVPAGTAGRSLLPLLTSGRSDPARTAVFTGLERHTWCRPGGLTYPMRAIRTRQYLYIRNFAPNRWPTGGPEFVSSNRAYHGDIDGGPTKDILVHESAPARFPEQHRLCLGKRPAEELYDVAADPGQIRNLAADRARAGDLKRLRSELERYLRRTEDPRIEGRDPWQDYIYHQTNGYGAAFNKSLPDDVRRKAAELGPHKPE
jgi:uncharacterized sulfatase